MTDRAWTLTLDAFEASLDAREAALADGLVQAVPPFEPPADLAPLPYDFADRAAELVRRCRVLETKLETALGDAREQLERLGETTQSPAPPAEPMFFDSKV